MYFHTQIFHYSFISVQNYWSFIISNNLPSSTLSILCPFNNSGQIQKLNFSSFISNKSRDSS
uniref:Ovule protein n=1 Tax=Meloidogyne incognita TaxID=6306 RepID=A0A914LWM2_MELIC